MSHAAENITKEKVNKFGFDPKYLSLSGAIFRYGLSKPTLYSLLNDGKISAKKFGRTIKFSDESLKAYYESLPSA